jgi:phosphoenolpyruvate carboxykinase (ATP)
MNTYLHRVLDALVGPEIYRNLSVAALYEHALREKGTVLTDTGALAVTSGAKTGRSPKDKRIVRHPASELDISWGNVNIPLSEEAFEACTQRATEYLKTRESLYVVDGYAGWDSNFRIKVRVICERPYHALFMRNMLITPSAEELAAFGDPDYVILNAGRQPADPSVQGITSTTSVSFSIEHGLVVILGTEYAGEMKKGVFTLMNYLMPKREVLSMHCSANEGDDGDVALFFGLSGTGKTTLSAHPHRKLIGDDEHLWTSEGISNIEGGCYAKAIHLHEESEPAIYRAIRYGALLENVVVDPDTRRVDYTDSSLTENTRVSYPIEFIRNAKIPCVAPHPHHVVFLTCDAFGVLPPVARLTPEQAMYHFISGYTAKVAGTEQGIVEPEATFSACFGAAFMVWHPGKYAELLAERLLLHGASAWLVNTGWTGGPYGEGSRMPLRYTRAIIDAIHSGELDTAHYRHDPIFGIAVPTRVSGVPDSLLIPRATWKNPERYDAARERLAKLFKENFVKYEAGCSSAIRNAGPRGV